MRRLLRLMVLAALGLLAGCAGAEPGEPAVVHGVHTASPSSAVVANTTDVMFAQLALDQIRQAVRVLPLCAQRGSTDDVRMLCTAMDATQAEEGQSLEAMLRSWNQPVAATLTPSAHAHHGGLFRFSEAELAAIRSGDGHQFDERLLNALLALQHTTVEVAELEAASGVDPEARSLAQRMVESRTAEIQYMLTLLAR